MIYKALKEVFHGDTKTIEAMLLEDVVYTYRSNEVYREYKGKAELLEFIQCQEVDCIVHRAILDRQEEYTYSHPFEIGRECYVLDVSSDMGYVALIFVDHTEDDRISKIEVIYDDDALFFIIEDPEDVSSEGKDIKSPKERLENFKYRYPLNLSLIERDIQKTDLNTCQDSYESILSEIMLSFRAHVQEYMPQNLSGECDEVPGKAVTQLLEVIKLFFLHGFKLIPEDKIVGNECLDNVRYLPCGTEAVNVMKYLLQQGAMALSEDKDESVINGLKLAFSYEYTSEQNFREAFFLEALYDMVMNVTEGKEYSEIDFYEECYGHILQKILKIQGENVYYLFFDEKILMLDGLDIRLTPYPYREETRVLEDISEYFKGCIGQKLESIAFDLPWGEAYNRVLEIEFHMENKMNLRVYDKKNRDKTSPEELILEQEQRKDIVDEETSLYEIIKGHDSGGYFWIQPVTVEETSGDDIQNVKKYEEAEISIEDINFWYYLYSVMSKYYDAQLIYNQQRDIDCTESNEVFEPFLVHNFYTYTCMEKMLTEYEERIKALETNEIELIKVAYKQYFMEHYRVTARMKYTDDLYIKECKVIREFYANFISHMRTMMKNNPQTDLISVKGP